MNFPRIVKPVMHSIFWYIKDWFCDRTDAEADGLWTITHGFLLEMRGLVEDTGEVVKEIDTIESRLDITEDAINDKSKGDFLTKTLVVSQTTWFIFQCTARWMVRLPVTQLEIVTLAFAFLNVITYALWWYKPQNIYVPLPMYRYTKTSDLSANEQPSHRTGMAKTEGLGNYSHRMVEVPREQARYGEQALLLGSASSQSSFHSRGTWGDRWAAWDLRQLRKKMEARVHVWAVALLDSQNWKQFGLKWFHYIAKPLEPLMVMVDGGGGSTMSKTFYSSGRGFDNWKASCSIGIIAFLFGGLHLIPAWSSFPSSQEKVLWQLSAFWITVEPPFLLCVSLFLQADLHDFEEKFLFRMRLSMFSIVLVGGLLYVLARLVLVLIALTTLRDLPQGAYRGVEWTTFLPHF